MMGGSSFVAGLRAQRTEAAVTAVPAPRVRLGLWVVDVLASVDAPARPFPSVSC